MSDVTVLVRSAVLVSLRRQRSLLLLMVLFVTTVLISNGLVGAGVSKYADSVQYRSALNLIELSSVAASARLQLDDETLKGAGTIDRVTGVYPFAQIDLALSDTADWPDVATNPGSLFATPLVPGLAPAVVAGALPPAGLGPGEIALPRDVPGGRLDGLLGKKVTMEFTRQVSTGRGEPARRVFTVVAITDNSTPGAAGPTPSYLAQDTLFGLIRASGASGTGPLSYTTAFVRTANPDDVPRVQRALAGDGVEALRLEGCAQALGLALGAPTKPWLRDAVEAELPGACAAFDAPLPVIDDVGAPTPPAPLLAFLSAAGRGGQLRPCEGGWTFHPLTSSALLAPLGERGTIVIRQPL